MKRFLLLFLFILPFTTHAQQGALTPGDNLVVDGIPPIPNSIVETVSKYTEFRSAGIRSWHPTKTEMLVITRFADVSQVHHVKMPGGARTQLTFFSDRVSGASFGPKNPDFFVFSKDIGGGEWFQNYRFDMNNGNVTLLTDGKSRNSLGVWSQDGSKMAYTSTRRTGKDADIYVIDPRNPASDRLLTENQGGGWGPRDWSPDGKTIILGENLSINESYLWLLDAETGNRTELIPRNRKDQVSYSGARFSHDGKGVYVTTDLDSEFQRLAYLDLATKKYRFLTDHIKWDVDDFELSPDGKTIAMITNEDGVGILRLLDANSGNEFPLPELPTGIVSGVQWHPSGTHLGFNFTSARSSTDVLLSRDRNGKSGAMDLQ